MYACLTLFAGVSLLPFLWMVSASLKNELEVFEFPIKWIPSPLRTENYREVFDQFPFVRYFWNSVKVSAAVTAGQLITCCLAGYAFSRLQFPGRDKLFVLYLATLMVPYQVIMIPQYFLMKNFGLLNSHWALILLEIFSPFGVFLMRQFFMQISHELTEAARIDGCGEFRIFGQIILPLSKPAFATLLIFSFSWVWNDFQAPLIYLHSDGLKTLTLGLASIQGQYFTQYNLIMAGAVIATLPVVVIFLAAQRYFVSGLTTGALKG